MEIVFEKSPEDVAFPFVRRHHHENNNNNIRSNEHGCTMSADQGVQRADVQTDCLSGAVCGNSTSGPRIIIPDGDVVLPHTRSANTPVSLTSSSETHLEIYHNRASLKAAAFKKLLILSHCLWAMFDLDSLPVSLMKKEKEHYKFLA